MQDNLTPAEAYVSTHRERRTSTAGGFAPVRWLPCFRDACRESAGGIPTVKVTQNLIGAQANVIEFRCHWPSMRLRPWELATEDLERLGFSR